MLYQDFLEYAGKEFEFMEDSQRFDSDQSLRVRYIDRHRDNLHFSWGGFLRVMILECVHGSPINEILDKIDHLDYSGYYDLFLKGLQAEKVKNAFYIREFLSKNLTPTPCFEKNYDIMFTLLTKKLKEKEITHSYALDSAKWLRYGLKNISKVKKYFSVT